MLVLTRKAGEQIRINDNVVVTVVKFNSERVWLGFDAPSDVSIHRDEVYQKICREKENEQQ